MARYPLEQVVACVSLYVAMSDCVYACVLPRALPYAAINLYKTLCAIQKTAINMANAMVEIGWVTFSSIKAVLC